MTSTRMLTVSERKLNCMKEWIISKQKIKEGISFVDGETYEAIPLLK